MNKIRIAIGTTILAVLVGCGTPTHADKAVDQAKSNPVPAVTTYATTDPVIPPIEATKQISAEQLNANGAAEDYLDGQSFSRTGLIKQLKFEGYSTKVATKAVDSLDADWNEQAVLSAKDYLDGQHFSRTGLIAQLKFEGFTTAQATHGVKGAGL